MTEVRTRWLPATPFPESTAPPPADAARAMSGAVHRECMQKGEASDCRDAEHVLCRRLACLDSLAPHLGYQFGEDTCKEVTTVNLGHVGACSF